MKRTPLRKVNPKRRASEFVRCYGSRERVAFVKSLPCIVCGRGPCDNAHIETGGMGRKSDYVKIAPLCQRHHRALHDWGRATFEREYLIDLDKAAAETERLWLAKSLRRAWLEQGQE